MNILSLFDGISGGQIALNKAFINIDNYFASEIDKYAIKITQKNYPNTIQLGNVSNISYKKGILTCDNGGFKIKKPDILIGGSPCFVAGTRIYTKNGYKKIEEIKVGEEVLTHKNRFRKVLNVGSTPYKPIWEIISLDDERFLTTENHPFMACKMEEAHYTSYEFIQVKDLKYDNYLMGPMNIGDGKTNYNYTKIKSIARTGMYAKVYNIEVEEDHTYMVETKFVHNCQSFTFAGKRVGMSTEDNIEILSLKQYLDYKNKGFKFSGQSYLFWEYVRLLKEVNPTYFLLENVKMESKWKNIISQALGVEPININSNLLSAQNRDRLYWTNINDGNIPLPNDKKIILKDILDKKMEEEFPLSKVHYEAFLKSYPNWKHCSIDGKSKPLLASYYKQPPHCPYIISKKTESGYRRLSPLECERLQTLPDNYTLVDGVSNTQRYKSIGNGWTIDVIAYLFSFIENYKYYEKILENCEICKEFKNFIDLEFKKLKQDINIYNYEINYKEIFNNYYGCS